MSVHNAWPKKVLVANRGEIALRVIRACRELEIPSVAVYSEFDRSALHVRSADEAVCIGPPQPGESYLLGERVLDAAKQRGADAIHPGYGFLSENADFAEAVADAGLTWIGPPAAAIRAMGEKVAARRLMKAAGVPLVPGLTDEADDPSALEEAANSIGYPVMIKASGGGGGKGIRIVDSADELVSAWERARSEAQTGFGNPAVYLERYLSQSRHVEIQVFADAHGNCVSVGERECSMQRRHQKVIEEAPSPVVDDDLRRRMGESAVLAARSVDYRGAGTVEFLVDGAGEFYFLEMNTRLQVEHPVTEMVTGLDLVREQLRVAAGQPLSFTQDDVALRGHAIEVRICAEEPERGFLPSTGTVTSLDVPGGANVRFDSGLFRGLEIGVHYDSMLAKLIVHGRDREAAVRRMRRALSELKITGLATNVAFLRRLLDSEQFVSGDYHTKSIEHDLDGLLAPPPEERRQVAALLAAAIHQRREASRAAEHTARRSREWAGRGRDRTHTRWHS